eukprot:Selendium_serpulae@DN2643_c0_g1_i2.p2
MAAVSRLTGAEIFAPNYRKAPETVWPGNLNDCLDAYRYLVESRNLDSGRIVLMGDSAGGNLALSTCIKSAQLDLPPPAGLALISPWLDLTASGPSYKENAKRDPILNPSNCERTSWLYLRGL